MRVLVTGAAGYIGGQTLLHLSDLGHEVVGFDRVNLAFNLVSVSLLLILLRDVVPSAAIRVGLIAAFLVEPHSPIRLSAFHPVSTDAAVMACVLAGLVGIYKTTPAGQELLHRVASGEFFGELAVINSVPRQATAIAL